MNRSKYTLFLAVLVTIGAGVGSSYAADAPAPAPAIKEAPATSATPQVLTGKIVVVDKAAGKVTLEVDGKLKMLIVGPKVKMVNKGKFVTIDQLATGQILAVLTRLSANGSYEVLAMSVEPSSVGAVAAGKSPKSDGKGRSAEASGRGLGRPSTAPFTTVANPANSAGPIISPSN